MPPVRRFIHKLRNLLQRGKAEQDLDREVCSHLALLEEDFQKRGLALPEARLAAKRAYGGVEIAKELQRDARSWILMERLLQDVRFAARSLRKNPTFSLVAIATVALGIGANTAIFTVLSNVLLRPLPYPHSGAIVTLGLTWQNGDSVNETLDVPQFEYFRDHNSAFQAVAGFRGGGAVPFRANGALEWISGVQATDGFFAALGVRPAIGRAIERNDTRTGSAPVAILSDAFWRKSFAADRRVLGRQIRLNGSGYTIVGVMPPSFAFVERPADVIVALQLGRTIADTGMNTRVIARMKPGITIAESQANMDAEFAAYRREGLAQSGQQGIQLESYQKWLAGDLRTSLLMLFAAVGFLLLIACANVASLLMARASARSREVSIRLAIGAGRLRLLQQFLVESLFIAVIGAAVGIVAAVWALDLLLPLVPWQTALLTHISVDGQVLLFTIALVVGATLFFGLTSYWQSAEANLNNSLKENSPASVQRSSRNRARNLLVAGEVAVSVTLLVGAGLLIESLYWLHEQKLGFNPDHVYTMTTPFEVDKNLTAQQAWIFEQEVLRRFKPIPGIASAAVVSSLPLSGPGNLPTQHEGHPEHSIGGMEYRAVSSQYFQALSVPVLQGRAFQDDDAASSLPVALVSETVARAWWNGKSPIGDRVIVGQYAGHQYPEVLEQPRQIVGVVADVKNLSIEETDPATVYVPVSQLPRAPRSTAWVIKTAGDLPVDTILRKTILAVKPDQQVQNIQPLSEIVAHSMAGSTFNTSLMSAFAVLALILTGVGLYGLLSFQVLRRTQEMGIRMALGAKRMHVVLLVIKEAAVLAGVGIMFGSLAAFILTRIMSSVLVGVRSNDPLVYAAVAGVLFCVALAASFTPARRASGIDPAVSLRYN